MSNWTSTTAPAAWNAPSFKMLVSRLYNAGLRVGAALVAARDEGRDAFKAIEAVLSWEVFSESVKEAEKLARQEEFDPLEQCAATNCDLAGN